MKITGTSITVGIDEAILFTNGKHWYYLVVGREGFQLAKPMDVRKGFKSRKDALRSIRDNWCLGWRDTEVVNMREVGRSGEP